MRAPFKCDGVFQDCTVMRVRRVTRYSLNLLTGEQTPHETSVETEPCGIPLFSDRLGTDTCPSCAAGAETEGNRPVRDENGKYVRYQEAGLKA